MARFTVTVFSMAVAAFCGMTGSYNGMKSAYAGTVVFPPHIEIAAPLFEKATLQNFIAHNS